MYRLPLPVVGSGPSTSRATYPLHVVPCVTCLQCSLAFLTFGFWLSIPFAVFAVVLEILERAHQVVSRLNLPAPLFTQKCVWKKVGRSCRSISTGNQVSGKHSRYHTGGRGTVLEKDSGKYLRGITIEPVYCHSYKILQSRVHSFAWFGEGKAERFFF